MLEFILTFLASKVEGKLLLSINEKTILIKVKIKMKFDSLAHL